MRFPTADINSIIQCLLFLTTKHISGHQIHQASVLDTDVILILTSVKTMKSRLKVIVLKDNKNYNMNRKENEWRMKLRKTEIIDILQYVKLSNLKKKTHMTGQGV